MDTLGIYVSVPFCRSKCSYCNFASGVFPEAYHAGYVERVIADIRGLRARMGVFGGLVPEVVDSVYLGGGTPSILRPELLSRLFRALREEFAVSRRAEVTLECAPGQIEDEVLTAMVESGVNRVSFGVQSFVDREAAVTGRLHNRTTALRDIARVKAAGVGSVNADLIAGLPHQTSESWRESLDVLVDSGVDHASVYMLEVDEDSRLGRELMDGGGRYHAGSVPSEDEVVDFYLEAVDRLSAAGFRQYEISNFAQLGRESVHNERYWLRRPYVGFGLDAHSMLRTGDGRAARFATGDDLEKFLAGPELEQFRVLSCAEELEETWFLGLRRNAGVSLRELRRDFGIDQVSEGEAVAAGLISEGLLEIWSDRIRLTERGRLLSNEVFGRFLALERIEEVELVSVI